MKASQGAECAPDVLVPDLVQVELPAGGRAVVFSDLHLGEQATPSSEQAAGEVTRAVDGWAGPGIVILAGDVFELLAEPHLDPGRALVSHPRMASALKAFAADPNRRVICLPGNHDGCLAWHKPAVAALTKVGIEVALAVEVLFETGGGPKRVRVEHGHQYDPANSFADPRNPAETPLGHHIVQDLLPIAKRPGAEWLEGLPTLSDPAEAAAFVGSRLAYRRLSRRFAVLLLPFLVALGFEVLATGFGIANHDSTADILQNWALGSTLVGVGLLAVLALATVMWIMALKGPLDIFKGVEAGGMSGPQNDAARSVARKLVGKGYAGFISGHTHECELSDLGGGFYANTGSGGAVVERRPGRLGLPPAFAIGRQVSWVELEAGSALHARLLYGHQELATTTFLERLATRPASDMSSRPEIVGSWPMGINWPPVVDDSRKRKWSRRLAAVAIGFAGLINIVSAVTPPFRHHLEAVTEVVPLAVSQTAAVLVALMGIALLLVARGVRRGQRHAWAVAVGMLLFSAILHLVKGLDWPEGIVALLTLLYLVARRRYFRVKEDSVSTRRGLMTLFVGGTVALAAAVGGIEWYQYRPHSKVQHKIGIGKALQAAAERAVNLHSIALPHAVDQFLRPSILSVTVGLVLAGGWLLFQPVRVSRLSARAPEAEEQARRLVEQYGGDTLAYFALRDDKRWFFWGDTVVAYAIHQGVCLVSPDPIGPVVERRDAWAAFRRFADDHGWPVAVMGASEGWLPIYRATGMHDVYVGDEAVVDVRRFTLEGGRNKGLRQAVNRIAKYGYRMEFHDPSEISDELKDGLRKLMGESRRGEVERGFSMTLSRIFNDNDRGLLLAVCFGPDNAPVAFCHYVPAAAINGYSLDLMRRSEGEHPNGLTDFTVVKTIEYLRDSGHVGLGLNFAVMRSILAGERGDKLQLRIQKWLLLKMSDSMQIESLWKFNAKFDPDWVSRYAVYDSAENLLSSAVAVARAESFWELPVIGRFFKPKAEVGEPAVQALPAMPDRVAPHRGEPVMEVELDAPVEFPPDEPVAESAVQAEVEGAGAAEPATNGVTEPAVEAEPVANGTAEVTPVVEPAPEPVSPTGSTTSN